jgi:hypothetical protein
MHAKEPFRSLSVFELPRKSDPGDSRLTMAVTLGIVLCAFKARAMVVTLRCFSSDSIELPQPFGAGASARAAAGSRLLS